MYSHGMEKYANLLRNFNTIWGIAMKTDGVKAKETKNTKKTKEKERKKQKEKEEKKEKKRWRGGY